MNNALRSAPISNHAWALALAGGVDGGGPVVVAAATRTRGL